MNAVAYLRVSGASQIDGGGFERQGSACLAFVSQKDFTVDRTFREEAISGTSEVLDRPAFQEMIAYMLDKGIKIVVVEELGRLAREFRIQEQLLLYIASKGLTLYAANTGENITEAIMADPMRKALVQIQGIFAELDKSMIVAKLRKGRQRVKKLQGRCEGAKPFGYRNEEESFTLAALMANHRFGMNSEEIAHHMNARRVPTRTGTPWNPRVISKIIRRELLTANKPSTCATVDELTAI
jgi:site-specific DNA recombinase